MHIYVYPCVCVDMVDNGHAHECVFDCYVAYISVYVHMCIFILLL